ncbi:MAG TPA: DNA polymerase III subunit beta, partial [Acidimicrobiales bacterium]|nr:DNA polymerase III subunit beta [Acidimicrobiales bacterium]
LPVLSGIRLEVVGNQLRLAGTDLDLTIQVETGVVGTADGVVVAPGRLVTDIIRALEPGAVTVESDDDEELRITAGRSQFAVRTHAAADFPRLPVPAGDAVTLPATGLAEALRQVVRAASSEDSRPILTGVLMAAEAGGLRLVATDSYRLAVRDLPGIGVLREGQRVLVPSRALGELQRLLGSSSGVVGASAAAAGPSAGAAAAGVSSGSADGDGSSDAASPATTDAASTTAPAAAPAPAVTLRLGERDATFELGSVRLSTRLIEGEFPNYRQLIPSGYPNNLLVGRDALLDAVRRVKLLVRDPTTPVRIALRSDGIELTVITQDWGQATEEVDAKYEGSEMTVAFNPTYLIDGVEAITSDEVRLETLDALKPATVKPTEGSDYLYLLMPVRVS